MRKAVIDLGTNSILLTVAEKTANGIGILFEDKEEPRLGKNFSAGGKLDFDAKRRTISALKQLLQKAKDFNPDEMRAFGTKILRDAVDSTEFLKTIEGGVGIKVRIISGEEEAAYAFRGALWGLDIDGESAIITDIGGGSTEIAFYDDKGGLKLISIPIGAVSITERFMPSTPADRKQYEQAKAVIEREISGGMINTGIRRKKLIFSGGTATAASAAILKLDKYNPQLVHGSRFDLDEIVQFSQMIDNADINERRRILCLDPKRADIISAGLLILVSVMKYFSAKEMIVSNGGVRIGFLLDLFN